MNFYSTNFNISTPTVVNTLPLQKSTVVPPSSTASLTTAIPPAACATAAAAAATAFMNDYERLQLLAAANSQYLNQNQLFTHMVKILPKLANNISISNFLLKQQTLIASNMHHSNELNFNDIQRQQHQQQIISSFIMNNSNLNHQNFFNPPKNDPSQIIKLFQQSTFNNETKAKGSFFLSFLLIFHNSFNKNYSIL